MTIVINQNGLRRYLGRSGGKTAATLYTLVQSARRNCVDVWPYLTDVLRRIAAIAPNGTAARERGRDREAQARRRRKRVIRRSVGME